MVRLTVHFSGRVQGVGFRYTTAQIARSYPVVGYVQNLHDGRVLLVVEGELDQAKAFVDEVNRRMGSYIQDQSIDRSAASGEFDHPPTSGLTVRY